MDWKELISLCRRFASAKMYAKALDALKAAYKLNKGETYQFLQGFRSQLTAESRTGNSEAYMCLREAYKLSARDYFDDFCIFTEWDRAPENKFYAPRRKQLLKIVKQLQRLADDELDILGISMPPGTGKTGLALFFLGFLVGRDPFHGILCGSHNASFLRGVYDECLRELNKDGEYLWNEIFPEYKVVKTNAQDMQINVGKEMRFPSLQMASIGSGNAGRVRAVQLLYCDDLVEGIEEAMSKERLDKKWQLYTTDLRQRKQGHCKELHIATRWSVHDILGRLEREYEGNPRAFFLTVPALDENGESNFNYGGQNGYTKEFYEDIMATMDDVSWRALYMNQPIEREGLLYDEQSLRYYYQLPEGEPDAVLAVCDTAEGGGDDTVMPVFAVYGNDHYMIDCVCSSGLPEVTDPICAETLMRNRVKMCQFESNAAGGRTADKVEEIVRAESTNRNIRPCSITKKRTLANKETKILVNSSFVKERCLFKDKKIVEKGSQYASFMKKLCSYSLSGKNKHDDVPDAMAQYALFTENIVGNEIKIVRRPF